MKINVERSTIFVFVQHIAMEKRNITTVFCVATGYRIFICTSISRHDLKFSGSLKSKIYRLCACAFIRIFSIGVCLRSNAYTTKPMNNLWNMCRPTGGAKSFWETTMSKKKITIKWNKTCFADSTCIVFLEHQIRWLCYGTPNICVWSTVSGEHRRCHVNLILLCLHVFVCDTHGWPSSFDWLTNKMNCGLVDEVIMGTRSINHFQFFSKLCPGFQWGEGVLAHKQCAGHWLFFMRAAQRENARWIPMWVTNKWQ